jgi:hypothetical protein
MDYPRAASEEVSQLTTAAGSSKAQGRSGASKEARMRRNSRGSCEAMQGKFRTVDVELFFAGFEQRTYAFD